MVKILSIDTTHSSSNIQMDKYGEEVVEHAFASNRELVESIMGQPDLFSAMRLINEINSLNGYDVISKYDVKEIKNYYNEKSRSSDVTDSNTKGISQKSKCVSYRTIFENSNLTSPRIFSNEIIKNEICSSQSLTNDNPQIKVEEGQSLNSISENTESVLSDLQRAYAEIGLM